MALYRMDDRPDAPSKAAILCTEDEARTWNTPDRAFGVFWTVNAFGTGNPRRKEFLKRIKAWAVDMDEGTKAEQHAKLMRSPLVPSMVIETKRGYQAYWGAQIGAKPEHWNAIVLERLVAHYGADKNARDLCRILRADGYLHLKDPATPFLCRAVWRHDVVYTERQIGEAYPWIPNLDDHKRQIADQHSAAVREARERERVDAVARGLAPAESFWEAAGRLNAIDSLARLSGSAYVNGESFTFRPTNRGRHNLFVDGKGTSVFIDENGMIGSLSGGGPTVAAFLHWYGHPWAYVAEALKWAHPHLVEIDAAGRAAWAAGRRAA